MSAIPTQPVAADPRESRPPLLVELVGPAGAGKTAILRAIARSDARTQAGMHISRFKYLPLMLWYSLALSPLGLDMLWENPRSWRSGMLHLLRLKTLHSVLAREASPDHRTIVLDEGPVFSLSRLSVFQNASRGPGRLARGWRAELDRWAQTLDVVVWLDAPDPVLAQRIRDRSKPHRIKDEGEEAVYEFLERYRVAYQEVLDLLKAGGRVQLVELPTAGWSADRSAAVILDALERIRPASASTSSA